MSAWTVENRHIDILVNALVEFDVVGRVPDANGAGGDDAEVALFNDGSASVYLHGVLVARKDVIGRVGLSADGTVAHNAVEDSFVSKPLTPYVLGVVENRARDCGARARRQLQHVAAAHGAGRNRRSERAAVGVALDA